MIAILKREFRSYLHGVTGWLFMAVLLLFTGIFVTLVNLIGGLASFESALSNITIVFLLIIPILTMRSIAEERHTKTDQLLYSLPLPLRSVVLAKYFAMVLILLIPVLVMAVYPILLSAFGIMNYAAAYGSLMGFFLLGCALIAIGMFISSLTESQIIAAVVSFAALLVMYLMNLLSYLIPSTAIASYVGFIILSLALAAIVYLLTSSYNVAVIVAAVCLLPLCLIYLFAPDVLAGSFPALLSYLAVFDRFGTFIYGIFDLTAIFYYLSIIVFFLFLTVQVMEKRRYS